MCCNKLFDMSINYTAMESLSSHRGNKILKYKTGYPSSKKAFQRWALHDQVMLSVTERKQDFNSRGK